jgi:hypothetical protein
MILIVHHRVMGAPGVLDSGGWAESKINGRVCATTSS